MSTFNEKIESERVELENNFNSKQKLLNNKSNCHKIAITSGKGGVGKTSVSLKLAKTLSEMGKRVLLIDCDYNLSNTAIKLGLPVENYFWDLLSSHKKFEECIIQYEGFHLLPSCNGCLDLFESTLNLEEIIIDIIRTHEEDYDFIILDSPAGVQKETLTLNAYCDSRFFIVTPDKSSIMDSYSLIKLLRKKYKILQNHLIVNMYFTQNQYEGVIKCLSETVENFLGGRTSVIGGIRKLDLRIEEFDKFFLHNRENKSHQDFCKVIKNFTDSLNNSSSEKDLTSMLKSSGTKLSMGESLEYQ